LDELIRIRVENERRLMGRVVSPTGEPVVRAKVNARISDYALPIYVSIFRAVTDNEGRFQLSGLPAVPFNVWVSDPDDRWVHRPQESIEGTMADGPELRLTMEAAVEISGKVVDSEGNPVEGAAISALADTREGSGLDDDVTDRLGRYRLRVSAGGAKLYFNALPDGFKYPDPQIIRNLAIAPDQPAITDLDFTLEREAGTKR
jgi:hypothetical protein